MSKQIEALKLALECIEAWDRGCDRDHYWRDIEAAITAIREALAEQPAEQEPVSGIVLRDGTPTFVYDWLIRSTDERLYTAPPSSKPWVSLTDEEKMAALVSVDAETRRLPPGFCDFANAVEAKLKEKNHG